MDSLNFRRNGTSPLSESRTIFFKMAFFSVFLWLIFELFNLRLTNWSYFSVPESRWVRWLGCFLAFATVIPAVKEFSVFFESYLKEKKLLGFRLKTTPVVFRLSYLLGMLGCLLPLVWPKLFFPLVWLFLIFLCDPINYRLNNRSLLKDFEKRDWSRFWSWVLAGFANGILWEFLNFWSGSHWEYSLPYFNFGKIFQMPVLGYLGFLPFALEIFVVYELFRYADHKLSSKKWLRILIIVIFLIIYAGVFHLMDLHTVRF